MRKVLITGATGMLGREVLMSLLPDSRFEIFAAGRSLSQLIPKQNQFDIDLSDPSTIQKINIRPDVIVHTAAMTDLALCEKSPELAALTHVDSTAELGRIAGQGSAFYYISTDSVFDGISGSYSEEDKPAPLNEYAKSKLQGELALRETMRGNPAVIRTNIYGRHFPLGNSLAEWAFREWRNGRTVTGFTDVFFNAVYTGQLAKVLKLLIEKEIYYPILNVGSTETISKFEFLVRLGEMLKVDSAYIKPGISSQFQSSVPKPKNTSLNTGLLSKICSVPEFSEGLNLLKEKMQIHD